MSEKVEFTGEVGQAVIGDLKEAPRLSNVVNLNLSEAKKEVQLITEYQRKRINVLVKEWAVICGDKELDIYKIFIADFGLRKFKQLPMEHYLRVKETLEGWIAASASKAPTASIETDRAKDKDYPHCAACTEKDTAFVRAQRTIFAQWAAIVILVISCGWLLYKMPVTYENAQYQTEKKCYFDGKSYSVGSAVRNVSGNLQECLLDEAAPQAKWQTVRRGK